MKRKAMVLMLAASLFSLAACQGGGGSASGPHSPVPQNTVGSPGTQTNPIKNPSADEYSISTTYFSKTEKLNLVIKSIRNDVRIRKVEYRNAADPNAKESEIEINDASLVSYTFSTEEKDLRPWNIQIRITTDAGSEIAHVFQPKDLKVDSIVNLSGYQLGGNVLALRNLEISKDGVLTVDLPSMTIETQNFTAEPGAILQNLSEEMAGVGAPYLSRGKNGGRIELNITRAEGSISFRLRGGRGGQGEAGRDIGPDEKGPPGANGQNSRETFSGQGRFLCLKKPTDGEPGGKGITGGNGQPGATGGDSGSIQLKILEGQLRYDIQHIPGKGGVGGRPGLGGPPGTPGEPGALGRFTGKCKGPVNRGANGPQGDPGQPGIDGNVGQMETSCMRFKDQKTCSMENSFGELK